MDYDAVADLPLRIEDVDLAGRERETSSGFTRHTTVVSLHGAGETGCGEDVTYDVDEHDPDRWAAVDLPPAGSYTVSSFSDRLAETALFPDGPSRPAFVDYRRWALESAALDLALHQAGRSLGDVLDREYDPVRFVVSTRLQAAEGADAPTADRLDRWLEIDPEIEFKLDPTPDWSPDLIEAVADTGAVRVLDFKGHYEDTEVETPASPELYERILAAFPDAVVEDPALTEATRPLFDGHEGRVSWDAPIHGAGDVEALPFEPDWLNCKPSRFGSVESLFETIDYCRKRDISLYGGGQFELDVGRGQIQALASLCYPDGPNDVAPGGYNEPDPAPGLPSSPLDPPAESPGFGWH